MKHLKVLRAQPDQGVANSEHIFGGGNGLCKPPPCAAVHTTRSAQPESLQLWVLALGEVQHAGVCSLVGPNSPVLCWDAGKIEKMPLPFHSISNSLFL